MCFSYMHLFLFLLAFADRYTGHISINLGKIGGCDFNRGGEGPLTKRAERHGLGNVGGGRASSKRNANNRHNNNNGNKDESCFTRDIEE